MASRIQVRRGTEADWTNVASSVTLAAGEPAVETGNSKGPLLYFGDGTTLFSGLNAQVGSFTPQSGSNTRHGHITATNDDYTFGMLETGDARSGDTYGMGNGSTLHVKDGATMTFGADGSATGTTVTVHDNVTTDFRNTPSFYDGVVFHVGLHTGTSSADGTVSIKRDTTDVVVVDDYGNITLTPSNDGSTEDTNLKLTMSDNADLALEILKANGDTILKVNDDDVRCIEDIILGSVPNHAIPGTFAKIRSGTNPGNTDASALSANESQPHFLLQVQGDSTNNQRGQIVLVGNRSVTTAQKSVVVRKNGESTHRLQADYDGNLELQGTLTANNAIVPNLPGQTRITQTSSIATYTINANTTASDMSFTRVTQLAVDITPVKAGSKILVEVVASGADTDLDNRPETGIGTIFEKVGSGSHVDLSGQDSSSSSDTIKALFFNSVHRDTGSSNDTPQHIQFNCQHLATPSYTLGDTLTYSLGIGCIGKDSGFDFTWQLNKSSDANSKYHKVECQSLIRVTEIPQ